MNAPYSFNFKYDPILENPFRSEIDYNKEIDERVRQLQLMKDKYNSTVKQTIQSESLWNKIDNEIKVIKLLLQCLLQLTLENYMIRNLNL